MSSFIFGDDAKRTGDDAKNAGESVDVFVFAFQELTTLESGFMSNVLASLTTGKNGEALPY